MIGHLSQCAGFPTETETRPLWSLLLLPLLFTGRVVCEQSGVGTEALAYAPLLVGGATGAVISVSPGASWIVLGSGLTDVF